MDPTAYGGWGGIRTHETVARLPVFKTGAFNHSATHPCPLHVAFRAALASRPGFGRTAPTLDNIAGTALNPVKPSMEDA